MKSRHLFFKLSKSQLVEKNVISLFVLLLGSVTAFLLSVVFPPLPVFQWSSDLTPLALIAACIVFWLAVLRPRDGIKVNAIRDAVVLAACIVGAAVLIALSSLSLEERIRMSGMNTVVFIVCWIIDRSLVSENSSVQPL